MTRVFNKRIFTIKEHFTIMNRAARSFNVLRHAKKHKLFNKQFKERIMLAVTEVNGCELCSYIHTKLSLSSGMSHTEILKILNGNKHDIPKNELIAVLFGEHYADTHEMPDQEAIDTLISKYGRAKSKVICAILAFITMTNSMGISIGLLKERLKFKRVKRSRIVNEIGIPLLTMTIFPILIIFYKIKSLFVKTNCRLIPNLN